jgi:hypothetical protein
MNARKNYHEADEVSRRVGRGARQARPRALRPTVGRRSCCRGRSGIRVHDSHRNDASAKASRERSTQNPNHNESTRETVDVLTTAQATRGAADGLACTVIRAVARPVRGSSRVIWPVAGPVRGSSRAAQTRASGATFGGGRHGAGSSPVGRRHWTLATYAAMSHERNRPLHMTAALGSIMDRRG